MKKYQWVKPLPMAMHGVIVKKDGTVVNVTVGDEETDPVVYIMASSDPSCVAQMQKEGSEVVEGEKLISSFDPEASR